MGLFSGKKKEVKKIDLPSVDDLPEFDSSDMPQFPVYEPSISDIKSEVSGIKNSSFESSVVDPEIPIRKPKPVKRFQEVEDVRVEEDSSFERRSTSNGKPLFVKIDKYKSALASMDVLRKKISDAEEILKEIDKVRVEEERALEKWRKDLSSIKGKLVELDEDLFEV